MRIPKELPKEVRREQYMQQLLQNKITPFELINELVNVQDDYEQLRERVVNNIHAEKKHYVQTKMTWIHILERLQHQDVVCFYIGGREMEVKHLYNEGKTLLFQFKEESYAVPITGKLLKKMFDSVIVDHANPPVYIQTPTGLITEYTITFSKRRKYMDERIHYDIYILQHA